MRIGELAERVGVSADTVRFYEKAGLMPRPSRRENRYREYSAADVEHLRLLIDLRRLEVPLDAAARIATWCHSGHCAEATDELPALIAARRREIAERIARLGELDQRLAGLEGHLRTGRVALPIVSHPAACCDAAGAVLGTETGCACCA